MQLSNEDMQQIRGVFTEMLNGLKSDMLAELRQEFAAQPPQPAEPPPPVDYFTAEQFRGLEQKLSDSTGKVSDLCNKIEKLSNAQEKLFQCIENIPAPGSFRDEATGGNSSDRNFI